MNQIRYISVVIIIFCLIIINLISSIIFNEIYNVFGYDIVDIFTTMGIVTLFVMLIYKELKKNGNTKIFQKSNKKN
jgi:uncharacterized BrkB/YihY/UPF0761 family membrane protein